MAGLVAATDHRLIQVVDIGHQARLARGDLWSLLGVYHFFHILYIDIIPILRHLFVKLYILQVLNIFITFLS